MRGRAPISLRLRVSLKRERRDVTELADNLVTNRKQADSEMQDLENGPWLSGHPELLFAIAAVVALRLALWNQAAEYAQLAAGADTVERNIRRHADREVRADYFEFLYLRA